MRYWAARQRRQRYGPEVHQSRCNLAEARQPAIIECNELHVAMLGYCSVLHEGYAAGPDTPGVASMRASARFEPVDYQPGAARA